MNGFIEKMAFKYRDNAIAKFLVRPFYRMKVKQEEKTRRKLYHKNAYELLMQLKHTLDSNKIFFWLEFGTLLGAYREKDFIKHDLDLDIGLFFDNPKLVRDAFENGGFKLKKEFRVGNDGNLGFEETYFYKGVTVDVFYFHKSEDVMYCNTFSPFKDEYTDMSTFQVKQITVPFTGFSKLTFKNMEFNVPADIATHLKCHYGNDFMIPNANFDYRKEATNIHWYKREERVAKYKSYM
ncbi:MAG: LicD family protein [Bacteroides sp.]|nr:LicD family protein [Bacteroides sp.]